jgi:hypothetical protein
VLIRVLLMKSYNQGRRLRFASGGIIMARAASLKIFFARGGIIHAETAKLTMLE